MPKPQKKHCALFMIFAAPAVIFLYILTRKSYHLLESMYVLLAIMFVFPLYLTVIYSFTIGKTKRSLKVLIGVAASGLAIFYWTIPSFLRGQYEFARNAFFVIEGGLILLEIWILFYILKNLRLIVRTFRIGRQNHFYFLSTYSHMLKKVFKEPVYFLRLIITEIAVFYYLTYRKKKRDISIPYPTYSYHKQTEYFGVFLMLVHAMLIEIIGVHLLVMQWSEAAAWIVTFFDVYFLLFLIADYRAITLSPIVLTNNQMHIQMGIRSFLELDYSNIEQITWEVTTKDLRKKEIDSYSVTLLAFFEEDPKFEIRLKHPVEVAGLFGTKKIVRKIYITVDDAKEFYDHVTMSINQTSGEKQAAYSN